MNKRKRNQLQTDEVPKGWEFKELGEVFNIASGKYLPASKRKKEGQFPVLGANGVLGKLDDYLISGPSVLIGRVGTLGEIYFKEEKCWPSDNVLYFKCSDTDRLKYLYYCLQLFDFTSLNAGSTQPLIRQSDVKKISLLIPRDAEIKQIISILSSLDDKIKLNKKTNKTLEEIGKAIFKHWFIDFEFPWNFEKNEFDLEGEPFKSGGGILKDTELGEIPENWKVKEIGDVANTQYGYTQSACEQEVGPHFLRVTDINKSDWILWDAVPFCEIDNAGLEKYKLKKGDIVIARMADPGKVAIIDNDSEDAVFASYLIRLKMKEPSITTAYFLFYYLNSPIFQTFVSGASTGTTRKSINATEIRSFDLLIPSPNIVRHFTETVNQLRINITKNVKETRNLNKIRDLLLPRLMSGRIRIKS